MAKNLTGLALLVLLTLVPVCLVPELPMLDLPNHLGRVFILSHLHDSAALRAMYGVRLVPTPNLGVDLLLTPLLLVLGPDVALRLFYALAILLMALAFATLRRVVRGSLDAVALVGLPLAYNLHTNHGVINYYLGVVSAVFGYALWLHLYEARPPRWVAWVCLPLLAIFTYLMHLVGFGVLMVAVGCSLAWACVRGQLRGKALLLQGLLLLAMAVPSVVLYLLFSSQAVGGSELHQGLIWPSPREKVLGLLRVLRATRPWAEVLYATVLLLLWANGVRRARGMVLAAGGGLLLIALICPSAFDLETAEIDQRVLLPALLLLAAGGMEWPEGRRWHQGMLALLFLAVGVRTAAVTMEWRKEARWNGEARQLCGVLPAGARVTTLHNEDPWPEQSPFWASENHGWAYCLLDLRRPLFFPALFHVPGSQPLSLRLPTYEGRDSVAHYHVKNGFVSRTQVAEIPWRELWEVSDYLWLSNWDLAQANPLSLVRPECFEEVGRRPHITVYRLRKESAGCP